MAIPGAGAKAGRCRALPRARAEVPVGQRPGSGQVEGAAGVLALQQEADRRHLVRDVDPGHPLASAAEGTARHQPEGQGHLRQGSALPRSARCRCAAGPAARPGDSASAVESSHSTQTSARKSLPGGEDSVTGLVAARAVVAHGRALEQHPGLARRPGGWPPGPPCPTRRGSPGCAASSSRSTARRRCSRPPGGRWRCRRRADWTSPQRVLPSHWTARVFREEGRPSWGCGSG